MTRSFQGKTGLVVGEASGVGRTVALAFAREGAHVVVADSDQKGGAETVRLIESNGGAALFAPVEVTQGASVEEMVASAVARFGRLDCAFNNSTISLAGGRLADADEAEFDRGVAVNVKATWLCLKYELRQMMAQGGGAIVNIGSVAAFSGMSSTRYPRPASSAYVAGKHAVVGLTRVAAMDYAGDNIRVNMVCPAVVSTPPLEDALKSVPEFKSALAAMHPMGRFAQADDVAAAVLWLCSEKSGFVTGHMLNVDGGYGAA